MIFKYQLLLNTGLSIVFSLGLLSCDKFLAGKPKKPDFIEVKKDNLKCLNELTTQVQSYLKSESNAQDIEDTFTCLDMTLNEFQMRAQGSQDANIFSQDDIFQIFQTFLADAQISNEATIDILKLKAALLGGSEKSLSKVEITQLRELLKALKPELYLLKPHMKLFAFTKADKIHSKEKIDQGFNQLNLTLKKLLAASQITRSVYSFEDFKRLLNNLQVVGSGSNGLLDLITGVKNFLTGSEVLQTTADFESVIDSFVEILRLYSVHTEGHVFFELKDSQTLSEALDYIENWFRIIENSLQFKKQNSIAATTIDALILKIGEQGFLSADLKSETLVQFYKIILVRVFSKGSEGKVSDFTGLNRLHLLNFRNELAAFKLYQSFINQLPFFAFKKTSGTDLTINEIQENLKNFNFKSKLSKTTELDASTQIRLLQSVDELRNEFLSKRPVIYRNDKMVVAANQEIWKQNWRDLTEAVIVKFYARGLLIGWGNASESRLVANATLTEANLVKWYDEFKTIGVEYKVFDPRSINTGSRSFKEANLFPYSADGNERMGFFETVQYLNILSSGGSQTLSEVQSGFAKAGCNTTEIDLFNNPWNNEACVIKDLKLNNKSYFNNLPYLVGFLSRLDDKKFYEFYDQAMEISRVNPLTKGKVETADIRTFIILLYYIEAMYAEFDVDRNWTFSAKEIRWSYPRFKSFATDFAQQTSADQISLFNLDIVKLAGYYCYSQENLIQESFIFLVYNGVTPGLTDLNIAPCFGKRALIDFSGEVDRKTLIKTFKILKAVLGS